MQDELLDEIALPKQPRQPNRGWIYGVLLLIQFLGSMLLLPKGGAGLSAMNRVVLGLFILVVCWSISALARLISRIFVRQDYPVRSRRFLTKNVVGGFIVWAFLEAFVWMFLVA